jgi:Leucine-rich repeat (LRR) protein
LSVLDIAGSSIDGAQFAEGHFWQGLKLLNIGNCKNVSPILKQVRGSTNLAILDVSGDQLEVTDYQLIATLPNLKMLNVNSNKLTTEDMHALSGLPKLAAIIAVYTRFTGGLPVEELRHFPALKSLTILRGYLKTTDLQLLKQGCPNLKVLEVSADQMKATGQIMEKDKWDE